MRKRAALVLVLLVVVLAPQLRAYSVLTHEELIDIVWDSDIVPLLKRRFPTATADDIRKAHAYAYGGAVIQDLGYYPFGSDFFSDLTHYVRSGDFVTEMLRDSQTLDDYAFSLGALMHYVSDKYGHPMAVNRAVAIEYPQLKAKFGPVVTYADEHSAHLKTEFGFDVVQVAKQRYAPNAYHDFIGFEVSKPVLERAFLHTYGLKLDDVIPHEDLAIGSYRRAISSVIPEMTKVALATRGKQMAKEYPTFNREKFLYHLSRAEYEKSWGNKYDRPGAGARLLAFLFRLVPKVGPFKGIAYKDPTAQTEDLYFKSVNATVENFRAVLRDAHDGRLDDLNLDTGHATRMGEYPLTDDTYAGWLMKVSENRFAHAEEPVRRDMAAFFGDFQMGRLHDRSKLRHNRGKLSRLENDLNTLRQALNASRVTQPDCSEEATGPCPSETPTRQNLPQHHPAQAAISTSGSSTPR